MMVRKNRKEIVLAIIIAFILIAFDQFTKFLAILKLKNNPDFEIIPNVFVLRYLPNDSAAFSLDPITLLDKIFHFKLFAENPAAFLNAKMIFFIIMTIIVIILLCLLYLKIPNTKHFCILNIILIFFISGAIGNCIDRCMNQYVVDFLYFKLINFPIFNVADIYVTCSAIATMFFGLFYYKESDYEEIFPSKEKHKR